MKDYSHYNALELAQDEDFARWVKDPVKDPRLNDHWSTWLLQNPDKREIIEEAKGLIAAVVREKQYPIAEPKKQELWERIENTISETQDEGSAGKTRSLMWYSLAATVSAILILSIWYVVNKNDSQLIAYRGGVSADGSQLLSVTNEGSKVHIVLLEDGSSVTLQPHSTLEYPEKFSDKKREVHLYGEAFFEVARDPQKPFSVHTQALVTQVLGTSFRIRAFDKEKDITVAVKTGKVSVFRESDKKAATPSLPSSAAILTPNQQIVFSKREERMVKSLVEDPSVMPEIKGKKNFEFRDTPIEEVFTALEEAYGVTIVFDKEVMSNCYLNASLNGVPFYDQLRMICKGINAQYEILDAHVIISGNGCN